MNMQRSSMAAALCALFALVVSGPVFAQAPTTVWTHHMDNGRTGWNNTETILNPTTVGSSNFGIVATTVLDGPVLAQPLVVPNQQITCVPQPQMTCKTKSGGTYTVVYVVTEFDSVYAIDAATGNVLLKRNLHPTGGTGYITSTPVIDTSVGLMYLVSASRQPPNVSWSVHALSLTNLTDSVPAQGITSAISATLSDGSTYNLNPTLVVSRAALLLENGSLYVALRAVGESNSADWGVSRGWLLQFNPTNLNYVNGYLIDNRAASNKTYFVTSIWMSNAGPATDENGNIYFVTGNSDPSGTSYDPVYNLEQSAIEVTPSLGIVSSFTPYNFPAMDKKDKDFGASGILKIPTAYLPSLPSLAVAGSKLGAMYLMAAGALGGYTFGGPDNVLASVNAGPCWCTPSFFVGADGVGRVVSSGGTDLMTWTIVQNGGSPTLVEEATVEVQTRNNGFFTSVSSNGVNPGTSGIIWAVARPGEDSTVVNLYAFNAIASNSTLTQIGVWDAGVWSVAYNPNIVPVVANGQVFVASVKQLTIFGLTQ